MRNLFIPYEQALVLEKFGFNEPCFGWFTDGYLRIGAIVENKHVQGEGELLAPTFSQAFDFFEKKFGLYVEWRIDGWKDDDKVDGEFICYRVFVWQVGKPRPGINEDISAGSKEQMNLVSLKHLVEIITEKKV